MKTHEEYYVDEENNRGIGKENSLRIAELQRDYGVRIESAEAVSRDQAPFAFRIRNELRKSYLGIELQLETIDNPDGSFTKSYDCIYDPSVRDLKLGIRIFDEPQSLYDYMEATHECIAILNGGYSFLTDETPQQPDNPNYNLCIREGIPVGLPASDYGALIIERRAARSVIYQDLEGKIHLRVFDGAPKTQNFKGLTPRETFNIIQPDTIRWGYLLDSGQSSRLVLRGNQSSTTIFGNLHYLKWLDNPKVPFLLDFKNGRRVTSAICINKSHEH